MARTGLPCLNYYPQSCQVRGLTAAISMRDKSERESSKKELAAVLPSSGRECVVVNGPRDGCFAWWALERSKFGHPLGLLLCMVARGRKRGDVAPFYPAPFLSQFL